MYYAILYKSLRKIHIRYTEMVYKLELFTYIKIPQYTGKIKKKVCWYIAFFYTFNNERIKKHLEYFLYIGKDNSMKIQANNYTCILMA